jgi:hypothetical protein
LGAPSSGPDGLNVATAATDRPFAKRWSDAPENLPLSPYFDAVSQAVTREAADAANASGQDWFSRQEASIAACMAQQGFEYFPQSADTDGGGQALDRPDHYLAIPHLAADRATVAEVGYGILTPTTVPEDQAENAERDPNTEYYDSLSVSAQVAYDGSLYGAAQAEYWRGEVATAPDEMGGCLGAAWRLFPDPAVALAEASPLTQFQELIGDMKLISRLDMFDDIELVELNREWRNCLPTDLAANLGDPGVIGAGPYGGPPGSFELAIRTTADGSIANLDVADDELSREQLGLTGSAAEAAVALADFDCRSATDYMARFIEIQTRIEAQFIDEHQHELNALLAVTAELG